MAECFTTGDIGSGIDNPMGTGNDTTAREGPQVDGQSKRIIDEAAEQFRRDSAEDYASTYADDAGASTERPTQKSEKQARSIARGLQRIYDAAVERAKERTNEFYTQFRRATGTTVGNATMWNNFQNTVYRWFVNQRGALHKYFSLYAKEAGKQNYENYLIRDFDQLLRLVLGTMGIFNKRIQAFMKELQPYTRGDMHADDLARLVGRYATARHAPEVNAHLIRNWREEAARYRAEYETALLKGTSETSPKMRNLAREINTRETRANRLEEHLESLDFNEELISSGYTNAQARIVQEDMIRQSGLSPELMEKFADRLSEEYRFILEERAKRGVLTPEMIASFPDFKYYVPMYSKNQNLSGATNDAAMFNPGHYRALEGRTDVPDDAFTTLSYYAGRAATEIGTQRLGLDLAALEKNFIERYGMEAWNNLPKAMREKLEGEHKDAAMRYARNYAHERFGLRSMDERELAQLSNSTNKYDRDKADNIYNVGGIMVDVPDGAGGSTRRMYWFSDGWSDPDAGLTGKMLNEAISSHYKLGTGAQTLQNITSLYGQSFTRYQPGFAPVAAIRDGLERMFHITNRDYLAENGQTIAGHKLLGAYLANIAKAPLTMLAAMRGKAPEGSKTAQYWREYNNEGLNQIFTPGQKQKTLEDMVNPKTSRVQKWIDTRQAKWVRDYASRTGEAGKQALQKLDTWNDYFQNLAAYAHYVTLREKGVSSREAAQGVLELMNMTQQGSISQYIGVISPFVRPTTQAGLAFARTFGLGASSPKDIFKAGKRGWIAGLGAYMAYTVLAPVIRETLGYDKDGNSYADAMSISQLTSSLPIGLGDGRYVKFPSGFGPQRVAAALAWATDRVNRGLMNPGEAAFEVLAAAGRDILPGNWPQFAFKDRPAEFITNMLAPAALTPVLQLSENTTFFGAPIHKNADPDKLKSMQGSMSTPQIWHQAARYLQQTFGFDVFPESLQHTAKALKLGPLNLVTTLLTGYAEGGSVRKNGSMPTALEEMGPWLGALGGALWYGKQRSAAQPVYYSIRKELFDKVKETGIDLKDHPKNLHGDALREWQRQRLLEKSDMSREDVDSYIRLQATEARLRGRGKEFNKQYKDRWMDMEDSQELKDAFEGLADYSDGEYSEFVRWYYGGRQ